MVDTYWNTQSQVPANKVLDPTPGDALLRPYLGLRGSVGVSLSAPQIAADAAALFPVFDGVSNILPNPPADYAAPTPASFMQWHSAHQVAWLGDFGTIITATDGPATITSRAATLGAGSNSLRLVLSADARQAIAVNTLTPDTIAKLPLEDQRLIALDPTFQTEIADPFGLRPASGDTSIDTVRTLMRQGVLAAQAIIQSAPDFVAGQGAAFLANPALRSNLYHYMFLEELGLLSQRLDGMAIFHPDSITAEVKAISERFERLHAYKSVVPETTTTTPSGTANVNSSDGGASMAQAAEIFVQVESRIYDMAVQRFNIAQTGLFQSRRLDTPSLTFLLQNMQTMSDEAKAEGKTEEMNQNNRLLEDYAAMQRALTRTLQVYNAPAVTPASLVALADGPATIAQADAPVMMFASRFAPGGFGGAAANTYHPVERLKNIERPLLDLVETDAPLWVGQKKSYWDRAANSLGEATKQLGQDTQIQMDTINQLNKMKNRHFELASNVLNKTAEMLRMLSSF